jgi:hypothetical protein
MPRLCGPGCRQKAIPQIAEAVDDSGRDENAFADWIDATFLSEPYFPFCMFEN